MRVRTFLARMWRAWLAVGAAGLVAIGSQWIDRLRPAPLDRQGVEIQVTRDGDAGIGTLRDAILAADRSRSRARIVLKTPRIHVSTPLPPLVNPLGVVIESEGKPTVIDAEPGVGPVLDVASPGSVIARLEIARADREAIVVRGNGARVSGVRLDRCATGIYLAAGADDLTVEHSAFDANGIGIHMSAPVRHVAIVDNHFHGHRRAGVWAVAPAAAPDRASGTLSIRDNRFDDDVQAVIVMNIDARIERNVVAGASTTALLVEGASAVVRANRIRSGRGFAVSLNRLVRGVVADNEIDHNCAGGIMVRNAAKTDITANRLYANGYGIVMVLGAPTSPNSVADNLVMRQVEDGLYIIGSSPVVRHNRVLDNRLAGLRVAALPSSGNQTIVSEPLLVANVLMGNGYDSLQDVYRPVSIALTEPALADCWWRRSDEARAQTEP
jgi:parallel beta helix pectate lyase-like protein